MATLAQGQITLVDYTDGSQITGRLQANQPLVQAINPDNGTRTPSWSAAPNKLVITPFFRRSGTTGLSTIVDASSKAGTVTSVNWYISTIDPLEPNRFPGGTPLSNTSHNSAFAIANGTPLYVTGPSYALQIKEDALKSSTFRVGDVNNVANGNIMSLALVCEVIEVDPSSGQHNTAFAEINFSALVQGGNVAAAVCNAPQGNIFKNGSIASLPASCTLYMAAVPNSTVTYQWYVQDSAGTDDQNAIASGIPGSGWRKLTSGYSLGTTGYATQTLTIPASAVPSLESFMCIVTDVENTNAKYFDTISFIDASDPFQIFMESTNGLTFKRGGAASTEIMAKLYQNNNQIDAAGTLYNYVWTKRDGTGATVAWTPVYKDGTKKNTVIVQTSDVANKATFTVEVNPKP